MDAKDYVIYRKTVGQMGQSLFADGNENNFIELGDHTVWRANFGNTNTPPVVAGVPEPTTAAIALLATIGWIGVRRRRK